MGFDIKVSVTVVFLEPFSWVVRIAVSGVAMVLGAKSSNVNLKILDIESIVSSISPSFMFLFVGHWMLLRLPSMKALNLLHCTLLKFRIRTGFCSHFGAQLDSQVCAASWSASNGMVSRRYK